MSRRTTHPPSAARVVLVDFDGTLYPWGQMFNVHTPLPGAVAGMRALREAGYVIGIFTSRLSATWHRAEGRDPVKGAEQHREYIAEVLERDGIPFDFITAEKVPSVLYLDDKAMRVNRFRRLGSAVKSFLELGDDAV